MVGSGDLWARAADHCAIWSGNRGTDAGLVCYQLLLRYATAPVPLFEEGSLGLILHLLACGTCIRINDLHLCIGLTQHWMLLVNKHLGCLRSYHIDVIGLVVWTTTTAIRMMLYRLSIQQ